MGRNDFWVVCESTNMREMGRFPLGTHMLGTHMFSWFIKATLFRISSCSHIPR